MTPDPQPAARRRVAVVTGGTRGIGAAVSRRLAADGFSVLAHGRGDDDSPAARALVQEVVADGGELTLASGDVRRAPDVVAMFDLAERTYGDIDVVVANAGVQGPEGVPLADTPDDVLRDVVETNLMGTLLVLREAARRVRPGGRVVTVSSTATAVKLPTFGPYAASKSAVETLTAVLAKELGRRAVTVNCVAPGPTDTDLFTTGKTAERIAAIAGMIPRGRIGRPEEIADVIAFLVGPDGSWVSGQVIGANGGMA